MRRLIVLAACWLMASLPVFAQRGGGHAGGGGHSGFSGGGGFGGHSSAGHAFSGVRSGSGFAARSSPRGSLRSPLGARNSYSRNSYSRNRSGAGLRLRTYGYGTGYGSRNNCYSYGCGWGYGYPYLGGGVDPYWWGDSDSSNDQDQQDQMGLADQMNQQSLDEQAMRQQANQNYYARSAPPAQHQPERTVAAPATVIVFRDQRKQEIQNYAIIGQTLWNFAPQHTEKIPLSELDLPATVKQNDDRGVDFRVPGINEGQ